MDASADGALADGALDASAADASAADASVADASSADASAPDAMPDAAPDAMPDAHPDAHPDAAPDAMPTTCIAQIFGDYIVLTDGRLQHYGGQIVMNAATAAPLDNIAEVVDQQWASCARRTDSSVWCWAKAAGVGLSGALGNGDAAGSATTAYAATPVQLAGGGTLGDALALQRGGQGFYPVPMCAIRADHTLWCWGAKTDGNLMQTGHDEGYPVQIKATPSTALTSVTQVSVAYREACVLAGGVVSCWGANIRGGLAQGDTTARLYPTPILNPPAGVTAIAAGQDGNYALAADHRVYAWGASGALGEGTATNQWTICNANYCQQTPTAVMTSAGVPLDDVSALVSEYLAACAVRGDGTVWCWGLGTGSNGYAQPLVFGGAPVAGVLGLASFATSGYDGTYYIKANHHYLRGSYDATVAVCGM
ncbi:MAG: hypothetical protein K8W52_25825 [Deltaproteobacteria bacterium]|nr:hypothetical protein [Deltaproteobacteria bacterium]